MITTKSSPVSTAPLLPDSRFHTRPSILLLATLTLNASLSLSAQAADVTPFDTPSLNPLTQIFGLPSPALPAVWSPGQTTLSLQQEVASIYAVERRSEGQVILDGEVWRTTLSLDYGLTENWLISLQLPFIQHKAGSLDSLIDDWHTFFGLPDGGRDERSQDEILYYYRDDNRVLHSSPREHQGIGDLQLSASRQFMLRDKQLFLTFDTKLPTGDVDKLTGSGALDLTLSAMVRDSETLAEQDVTLFWGAAISHLGKADSGLNRAQKQWLWAIRAGAGWALRPNLHLKAQLDHHSAVYNTELRPLGSHALQLTAGLSWYLAPHTQLDLAFSEDLATTVTPDITFSAGLRQGF